MMRRLRDDQSGFTLMELVIAGALGVIVLLLVGTFMMSSFAAQSRVTATTQAASNAQLLVRQLEDRLTQASAMSVQSGTNGSQLLIARTATEVKDSQFNCTAYFYDDTAKAIFIATFDGKSTMPWGSSITSWIDLGSGLKDVLDVGTVLNDTLKWLFGGKTGVGQAQWSVLATGVDSSGSTPVFRLSGTQSASITFDYTAGAGRNPIFITTDVTGRQPTGVKDPECF